MNTIEIKISKTKALDKTKSMLQTIEIFMLKKGIQLSEDEIKQIHNDFAESIMRINLAIEE